MEKHIEALIARAAEKNLTPLEAMQFAQAAANAANAMAVLASVKRAV